MRVTSLTIKNVGLIADTKINFDKPLLVFYGEIKQGKSTLLNAVRWCFGGEFPQDIIRHGAEEAEVTIALDNGSITRSWYRGKGGTKARPIVFVRGGEAVRNPVAEIKTLLNPFLLDQDHLRNMNELARKKFFSELFPIDTAALDAEEKQL